MTAPSLAEQVQHPDEAHPDAVIELRAITKTYSSGGEVEVKALGGIDLTVRNGDYVAVVGASGSGK